MNLELKNQTVLITGSGSGIGRGIAEGFLKEKALVIITDLNKTALINTENEFSSKYSVEKILKYFGDLDKPDILKSLYQFIMDKTGGLDHLVCNIGSGMSAPPLDENVTEFQRMLDINLLNAVGIVNQFYWILTRKWVLKNRRGFPVNTKLTVNFFTVILPTNHKY